MTHFYNACLRSSADVVASVVRSDFRHTRRKYVVLVANRIYVQDFIFQSDYTLPSSLPWALLLVVIVTISNIIINIFISTSITSPIPTFHTSCTLSLHRGWDLRMNSSCTAVAKI